MMAQRVGAEKKAEGVVEVGVTALHDKRRFKEGFGEDGEEFSGVLGGVGVDLGIDPRCVGRIELLAEVVLGAMEGCLPGLAPGSRHWRDAVGVAVAHIDLVNEFMDDDVVAAARHHHIAP